MAIAAAELAVAPELAQLRLHSTCYTGPLNLIVGLRHWLCSESNYG